MCDQQIKHMDKPKYRLRKAGNKLTDFIYQRIKLNVYRGESLFACFLYFGKNQPSSVTNNCRKK